MKRAKDKAVAVAFEKVLLMILGKYHTTYSAILQCTLQTVGTSILCN